MSPDKVDAREAWIAGAEKLANEIANQHLLCRLHAESNINAALQALLSHLRTTPEGYTLLRNSTHEERSWPEDSSHENGDYYNTCCDCRRQFVGHKRRIVCKVCANEKPR